jgi:hypothetical protein
MIPSIRPRDQLLFAADRQSTYTKDEILAHARHEILKRVPDFPFRARPALSKPP